MKYIGIRIVCIIILISCYPVNTIALDWGWFNKKEVDKKEIVYILGDTIPEVVIENMISEVATGTKAYQMERTIFCESEYQNIQSRMIKNGEQEDSWGIAQINLYWNNKVTKEQALDPKYSIKWMSDNWNTTVWYAYNRKTDTCNK